MAVEPGRLYFATVTDDSPLEVRIDGTVAAVPITLNLSGSSTPAVGTRCTVMVVSNLLALISSSSAPRGIIAWKNGVDEGVSVGTGLAIYALTTALKTGRMYDISYGVRAASCTGGNWMRMAVTSTSNVVTTDDYMYAAGNYGGRLGGRVFTVPSDANYTFTVTAFHGGTSGLIWTGGCTLSIRDIGAAIAAS